jgi:hypothetical protein
VKEEIIDRIERMAALVEEEQGRPVRWWYLSFATEESAKAVMVKACGFATAYMTCNFLGINPGGQVMGLEIPDEMAPSAKYIYRVLTKQEVEECWNEPVISLRELRKMTESEPN